ncbi:MAG: response regulator [Chloroflexi bacterium]|nr:response regulator [Chloroflexota bacterium]
MISRDEFERHVKDALANLYDPPHLQTHPLAGLLALEHGAGQTVAEKLRDLLRETLVALKPPVSIPADRPEWLGYRVLWLRYVRALGESEVCQELNVSESTFYRRQREALEAVVSLLWERYQQLRAQAPPSGGEQAEPVTIEQARARAIGLVGASSWERIDLAELIGGVREVIEPLARGRGVSLRVDLPPSLPTVYGEPSVLRQVFLNVLAECIELSPGGALDLGAKLREGELLWHVRGLAWPEAEALERRSGFALSRDLLSLYQGRIWLEASDRRAPALLFTVAIPKARSILIVDDDPATVNLYRRYLQGEGYVVLEAHTAEQTEQLLAETRPDLVLLDVMMPRVDGWTILRTLKSRSDVTSIPVVVCSVIDQPSLALALGAAEVLTKPITSQQLRRAIRVQLGREGTTGSARPGSPSGT